LARETLWHRALNDLRSFNPAQDGRIQFPFMCWRWLEL